MAKVMPKLNGGFHVLLLAFALANAVLAQGTSGNTGNSNPFFLPGVVAIIVCVLRRNKPIGGWLAYFMVQAILGGAALFVTSLGQVRYYTPAPWGDTTRYVMFLGSEIPHLLVALALTILTVQLLRTHEWTIVEWIRIALLSDLVVTVAAINIDLFFFRSKLSADAMLLIFSAAFLAYFYRSRRVRQVFQTKEWTSDLPGLPSLFGTR
jgi:hypothetical protein